jgi:hypothetical protein
MVYGSVGEKTVEVVNTLTYERISFALPINKL